MQQLGGIRRLKMKCEKCGAEECENVDLLMAYPARLCLKCRRRIQVEMLGNEAFANLRLLLSKHRMFVQTHSVDSEEATKVQMEIYRVQRDLFPVIEELLKPDKVVDRVEGNVIHLRKKE